MRRELLCNERSVDPEDRRRRLLAALAEAHAARPDHIVITGDLTEDGTPAQFEALAEIFHEAGLDPSRTTLTAGNHDAYSGVRAFDDALAGPLAAFAETSAPGTVVDLGPVTVLPVCTRIEQPFIRAAGLVGDGARERLERTLRDPAIACRPSVVAIHHPLVQRTVPAFHWFDGLIDAEQTTALLRRHRRVTVLHGHFHREMDLPIGDEVRVRSRGAKAVVDDGRTVRVYDVSADALVPVSHGAFGWEKRSGSASSPAAEGLFS